MKKILTLLILFILFIVIYSVEYYARHDDADSNFVKWYGANYRATKYSVSAPCTIFSIEWGRYTRLNETDTLYIWQGNSNYPESLLYKKPITINSNRADSIFTDTIYNDTFIIVQDIFWIGFYSRTQDVPASGSSYFLGDTVGTGNSYYSDDMITWTENLQTDYIIRATLYGDSGIILLLNEDKFSYDFIPNYNNTNIIITHHNTYFNIAVFSETKIYTMKIKIIDIKTGRIIHNLYKSLNSYMDNVLLNINHLNLKSSKYLLLIKINNKHIFTHPFNILNKKIL